MSDVMVIKSESIQPLLKSVIAPTPPLESTLDGQAIAWPYDPNGLLMLYGASSEHQGCCQVKAEIAYGTGAEGPAAKALAALLPKKIGLASFCVQLGLDLETYGNAFVEKIWAGSKLIGLRHRPSRTMMQAKNGGYVQWVYEVDGDLKIIYFTEEEILHIREPCVAGLHYAQPTWIGGRGMVELVYAATEYNSSFFRNRAIPDYAVITKNGALSNPAKTSVKEFFQQNFQGPENAHRVVYIPAQADTEVDFKKLTEDRKDADFLKLLDAGRDRIITAHRVPPRLLGIVSAGQLGGGGEVEGQLHMFEQISAKPKRRRMAENLQSIVEEVGVREELEFRAMPITQPGKSADNIDRLVAAGIYTPAEARKIVEAQKSRGQANALVAALMAS